MELSATLDQSLCRGIGGGTRPPPEMRVKRGIGGLPPIRVFAKEQLTFSLSWGGFTNKQRFPAQLPLKPAPTKCDIYKTKWYN